MLAAAPVFPTTVSLPRAPRMLAVVMAAAALIGLAAGAAWPIALTQPDGQSLYAAAKVPG